MDQATQARRGSAPSFEVNQALFQRVASAGFCIRVEPSPRLQPKAMSAQTFAFYFGPKSRSSALEKAVS